MVDKCEARNRPMLAAVNPVDKLVILFRPRCRSWSCPYCAEVNRKLWTVRAYAGTESLISGGYEMKFVTITSHERLEARQTWYVWPRAWKKLSTRLKRAHSAPQQYFMIPEQHKDGRLHMHALSTWTISQSWLKDNARESGLGFMQEIEPVKTPEKGAWECSKYLSKQLKMLDWPTGWRHVRTSRGWPRLPKSEPQRWFFDTLNGESAAERSDRYKERGLTVLVMPHSLAWEIVEEFESRHLPE